MNPVRLPADVFTDLDFVPYPVAEGEEYKEFDTVYRTPTSEDHRPSLKSSAKPTEQDKKFKSLLVGGMLQSLIVLYFSKGSLNEIGLSFKTKLWSKTFSMCNYNRLNLETTRQKSCTGNTICPYAQYLY